MITIGIEKHHGVVYEGDGNYGRGVWPTPVITPACFVYPSEGDLKAHPSSDVFGYRFREDSFDPIARIRRGRFYHAAQQQPMQWARCSHHPGFPLDAIDRRFMQKTKVWKRFTATRSGINISKGSRSCLLFCQVWMIALRHGRLLMWRLSSLEKTL